MGCVRRRGKLGKLKLKHLNGEVLKKRLRLN